MEASLARTVLEAAPIAILAFDESGTLRLANPTARSFWQGELVVGGTSLSSLLPRFDLETMVPRERHHKPVTLKASIAGNDRDLVVFSVPFDSPKGHLTALFIRDETERVQTEHALERLRNEVLRAYHPACNALILLRFDSRRLGGLTQSVLNIVH